MSLNTAQLKTQPRTQPRALGSRKMAGMSLCFVTLRETGYIDLECIFYIQLYHNLLDISIVVVIASHWLTIQMNDPPIAKNTN